MSEHTKVVILLFVAPPMALLAGLGLPLERWVGIDKAVMLTLAGIFGPMVYAFIRYVVLDD